MDRTPAEARSTPVSEHAARPDDVRPWWLLLLPASYLLHIAEEWWGGEGFAAWTARTVGSPISTTRFLVVNAILWPLSLVFTSLGILKPRLAWLPVALATIVTINAVLHTLGTLATTAYSPGLVTSLLLYVPVGGAALAHGSRTLPEARFRLGVIVGFFIHALVIVIALA